MRKKGTASCCGRECPGHRPRHCWVKWVFPVTGLLALVWFLIRVVPKPSRATYPCQRVAMPLASGFVVWLVALVTSITVFRGVRRLVRESRVILVSICLGTAAVTGVVSFADFPDRLAKTGEPWGPHRPIGEAKGIHPGRVVWVHDPNATDWDGYDSPEHWDNAANKQYSRNLGTGEGIELILLHSTAIRGDIDSDGDVHIRDLSALCENWLQRADPNDLDADLNGDHTVDLKDLAILGRDWGTVSTQQ